MRESEVAQSCLTLCDPMDCSLPGSSVHGICQARVLEWGATAVLLVGVKNEDSGGRQVGRGRLSGPGCGIQELLHQAVVVQLLGHV